MSPDLGEVRTQRAVLFTEDDPLLLASGRTLGPVEVAYETYGTLSPACDNVVYVCHALTGDAHAAGHHGDRRRRGWWDTLIGPGKPIDTDRFFVVCANLLGGCQGSTGPASLDPATGRPYGLDFPLLAMSDFVTVHRALLRHLGIERLAAAIGGSLGGMQVLQWVLDAPDQIDAAILVCATSRLTAQNIAFSAVAREAIMSDEHFQDGRYPGTGRSPDAGLAVARMMAHITYVSEAAMAEKFGRRFQDAEEPRYRFGVDFQVESYLQHQASTFLDRFDALSYLYLSRVMDYFDPFARPGAATRIASGGTRFLVVSFDTDWRFGTAHSLRIVRHLERAGVPVSFREIASPWGHDSFLLEVPDYHATVTSFLATAPPGHGAPGADGLRRDQQVVASLVPHGSRVLDLGCGDGALLAHLIARRGCTGTGVERAGDAIVATLRRGVPVLGLDLDLPPGSGVPGGLGELADGGYDVVLLSQTLQATAHPADVLRELARLAPLAVVSVPNFGLWRHRTRLLLRGRMPMSAELPYPWYETPNIHLSTLPDLEALVAEVGLVVQRRILLDEQHRRLPRRAAAVAPNLLAANAVYVLGRQAAG
jgi:homoserine O-acetyltransferase